MVKRLLKYLEVTSYLDVGKLHSIKIKFGVSVAAQATQNILRPR